MPRRVAFGLMPWILLWCLFSMSAASIPDDDCATTAATSLLQTAVVSRAGAAASSVLEAPLVQQKSQCMAEDLEKVLKGLQDRSEQNLNKYLGFPMILLLCASLLVLLMGHRLVTIVVLTSVVLAGFFLTFEFMREVTHHSCSAPVWVAVAVALIAAGASLCFLEIAIVVPGALFGAILAYQVQAILLTASPQLESNAFMVQYYFIIALLAAIVFAYIAHKLKDDIFILFTAVLGAFGFEIALRGTLLDYFSVHMSTLASLICMICAFIVGLAVQHRNAK